MKWAALRTLVVIGFASVVLHGAQTSIFRLRFLQAGGGGGSLVAQGLHPRTGGLSSATIPTIATKINAYYDDDPVVTYSDIAGSFPDFVAELDADYGASATQANGLNLAHAYCLLGNLLPSLTTGGGTGISPAHTATQYGQEGARLAAAITSLSGVDGGFPQANAPYAYDWCYPWLDATQRSNLRAALDDFEADCDSLGASPWVADSNKTCSAMYASAVAMAGDSGETWGTTHLSEWDSVMADSDTGIIGSESKVANLYKSAYGYGSCATPGLAYMSYMWQYDTLASETYRFGATTQTPSQFYDLTKYSFLPSGVYCLNNLTRPYAPTRGGEPNSLQWFLMRTQYAGTDQQDPNDASDFPLAAFAGIWNSVESAPAQLAMWYQRERLTARGVTATTASRVWPWRFTLEDPTIAESSPSSLSLPLSARYGDGSYWFRSAWDTSNAVGGYWAIKITLPAFSVPGDGREAMNMSGAIEIHRKGAQLIWRGAGAHVPIAHGGANTLYFFDSGRTTNWDGASSGSSPWNSIINGRPLGWTSQPQASSRGADIVQGGSKDYLNGDAYIRKRFASGNVTTDYVYADRRNSYPRTGWYTTASAPAEESEVISQYIIFRPGSATGAARIARYEVVTNTSNTYDPLIAWNPSTDSITVDGSTSAGALHGLTTHGFLKSTNSHILTASNAYDLTGYTTSGRNTLTVVHPSSATIVIGGGPDESSGNCTYNDSDGNWDDSTAPNSSTSLEAVDYYGFRHPHSGSGPCADVDRKATQGRYFATVSPTSVPNGTRTDFLLFYEADDNGSTAAVVTELTSLTNFSGFQWRDTDMNGIAVFGANGADQTSGAFTIPTAGTYTLTIANLSGSSRVFSSSGCFSATNLADGDTDLTFAVDTASKTITMTAVTSGANCAVSVN